MLKPIGFDLGSQVTPITLSMIRRRRGRAAAFCTSVKRVNSFGNSTDPMIHIPPCASCGHSARTDPMSSDEEEGRIGFEVTEEDEENEFYRGHRK
jgi:hypothetical protein